MRKKMLAALCLLVMLMLICVTAVGQTTQVRIRLTRWKLTDRVDLVTQGNYRCETASGASLLFAPGSKLTVVLRGEKLYLFYESMSVNCGSKIELKRYASDSKELEGLRLSGSSVLYPGDLTLTASGGQLLPVLKMPVDEYLLGVVPHEMSDSFPLEALKAQAVCARTYALSRINATAAWDMTDTTADQVFYGVDSRYTNAARAVQETAGLVGVWKNKLAICYYAASNGGQTERVSSVWPVKDSDYGYYDMREDPYDVENPESIVRKAVVSRNGTTLNEALTALIWQAMADKLDNGTTRDYFRIDRVEALALTDQALPGSRRYETMQVTFAWSTRRTVTPDGDSEVYLFSGATAEPPVQTTPYITEWYPAGNATVSLKVYPDVVDALRISIASTNTEILTITAKDDSFVVESRRYGHGVGMSQRGAQWMASHYGKKFDEILNFYYPGMEVRKADTSAPIRPTVEPALAATPGPAATATPRPTLMPVSTVPKEGERIALVENIEDDSTLNLRDDASPAANILMRLYKHQRLLVLNDSPAEGWVHVRTDSVEGYVMEKFLVYEDEMVEP